MKQSSLKQNWLLPLAIFAFSAVTIVASTYGNNKKVSKKETVKCCSNPTPNHVCVMKTIFGIDNSEEGKKINAFITNPMVEAAVKKGLDWIALAQGTDGGWGSGSHYAQNIRDPHAVPSDPASTSLVSMSLLRNENTLNKGKYAENLKKGMEYLLNAVENCPANQVRITTLQNTQVQTKLGKNI